MADELAKVLLTNPLKSLSYKNPSRGPEIPEELKRF